MLYINPEGEFPRHIGDIWIDYPNFKDGDELPEGWVKVEEVPLPNKTDDQIVEQGYPVEVDGVMTQNWQVRDMTAEEIERRNAPKTARQKLIDLGLTEVEIDALLRGLR